MKELNEGPIQSTEGLRQELDDLRLLHRIAEKFSSNLEFDELIPEVFNDILDAVDAQGGSIWLAEGDQLRCALTLGSASQKKLGTTIPIGTGFVGDVARKQRSTLVTRAIEDERFEERIDRTSSMITTNLIAAPMVARDITVGAIEVTNKRGGLGIFVDRDRLLLEGLARAAAVAIRNAQLHAAEKKAKDLSVLLDISHEITSTLDMDHVLSSVVNQATRAFSFDLGAVGTSAHQQCMIRAMAGEEEVDPSSEDVTALAKRGRWTIGRGETFYLPDLNQPETDSAQTFAHAFGGELTEAGMRSGLYIPLKDEEGTLGVLIFESKEPDFATDSQQELAHLLANQTTVALRNAELYNQVPMADLLGAITRKRRQIMQLPRSRLLVMMLTAILVLASVTLITWPLRVRGNAPTFRAAKMLAVRPLVRGVVERVLVLEGDRVTRGTPLAQLRDFALQSQRDALEGDIKSAERTAVEAASSGNRAAEQISLNDVATLRRELGLIDEQIAATVIRSPFDGSILTSRPEEKTGVFLEAGDELVTVGRIDEIEVTMGVAEYDLERVRVGQQVRFRIASLPQQTFSGEVTSIAQLPLTDPGSPYYEIRASAPNADGLFKPGMAAYARILTDSESMVFRTFRAPARWFRLLWWRIKP